MKDSSDRYICLGCEREWSWSRTYGLFHCKCSDAADPRNWTKIPNKEDLDEMEHSLRSLNVR